MAFCKYCGTKLEDGQTCTCADAVAAAQAAAPAAQAAAPAAEEAAPAVEAAAQAAETAAPAAEAAPQATAPVTTKTITLPNVDKEYVRGIWGQFLNIIKAPATGGAEFITGKNHIAAAIIICVQAILSGIISCFYIGQINAVLGTVGGAFIKMDKYKFSGIKAFFLSIIFSVLFAAIFAGLMFAIGKILKLEMDIKQALEIAAVRAVYLIPITALAAFLSLINVVISVAIYTTASVFALAFVLAAMITKYKEKANILVYVVTLTIFIFVIVMAMIMGRSLNLYIPGSIKSDIGNVGNLMQYFM